MGWASGDGKSRAAVLSLKTSGARAMLSGQPVSHSAARIERPLCPKCKTQMMLARIAPGRTGFELQSFDCPKCNHELTTEVPEEDPLEKLKGWLFGELGRST
jgi:transposase-like protein